MIFTTKPDDLAGTTPVSSLRDAGHFWGGCINIPMLLRPLIKKYDWRSGRWITPQCFPQFCPTNCPIGISKVSNSIFKRKRETDVNMMRKIIFFSSSDCNFTTISYKSQENVRLKNKPLSVAVSFICLSGAGNYRAEQSCLNGDAACSFSHKLSGA